MKFTACIVCLFSVGDSLSFVSRCGRSSMTSTTLRMGLFDGVKDAFSAPELSKAVVDKDRETPIDRWMGWSVVSEKDEDSNEDTKAAVVKKNFVDSMDKSNYIIDKLTKPMGIVFEENDEDVNGIFVLSLTEGGVAEADGVIKPGDQLIAVDDKKVIGMLFDDALGTIIDASNEKTQLLFFRGSAADCYGPTRASQEWLDNYIKEVNTVPVEQSVEQ